MKTLIKQFYAYLFTLVSTLILNCNIGEHKASYKNFW